VAERKEMKSKRQTTVLLSEDRQLEVSLSKGRQLEVSFSEDRQDEDNDTANGASATPRRDFTFHPAHLVTSNVSQQEKEMEKDEN
jgi:hypothetical protein